MVYHFLQEGLRPPLSTFCHTHVTREPQTKKNINFRCIARKHHRQPKGSAERYSTSWGAQGAIGSCSRVSKKLVGDSSFRKKGRGDIVFFSSPLPSSSAGLASLDKTTSTSSLSVSIIKQPPNRVHVGLCMYGASSSLSTSM